MSQRARHLEMGYELEVPKSRCSRFLSYTWKFISCVISHIMLVSMVISYCVMGAWTFEKLEMGYEVTVKQNISYIRGNVTDKIWEYTLNAPALNEVDWIGNVTVILESFDGEILWAMKKNGWDGIEDPNTVQWTFAGALFYSITVITTIGYGHIAPKTHWGKVVTIFYAILGIPLMLLCLSNIGDIMATCFKFLYWRVCCYICTKKPKRSHNRRVRGRSTIRQPNSRYAGRSRSATSFKRPARTSKRSDDSGFGVSCPSSYSDPEFRHFDDNGGPSTLKRQLRPSQMSRFSDTSVPPPSYRSRGATPKVVTPARGGSLDSRPHTARPMGPVSATQGLEIQPAEQTPVLFNKYAMDHHGQQSIPLGRINDEVDRSRRSHSVPRQQFLEPPPIRATYDDLPVRPKGRRRQGAHRSSPGIMSPMGFAVSHQYYDDYYDAEYDDYSDDGGSYYISNGEKHIKPVPIWLCVFLVISYIFAGAWMFSEWEGWAFLDACYFCFITLTTIGFGDLVPAKNITTSKEVTTSIALCSLYLLFGISLLAMSFNLVQEEVIANCKSVAKRLGIIKEDDSDDEYD